ncbi:hypothetical protein [Kitasatospora sp. NPDC051914]|uniref:hypothetical protein n=1 Tax=Kitasatospora sp. NPDC051914 TaxID=3154945 RepID=UPI003428022B
MLAVLADGRTGAAELDGAAVLFGILDWTKANGRELPEPVRSRLFGRIQAHSTGPMRFRLERGSYGVASG